MKGGRNIAIMLAAGVLLAGILVFVMRDDVRLAARDAWERVTGRTVTVIDTDTGEESVMPETSYAEEVADDGEDGDAEAALEEDAGDAEEDASAGVISDAYADAWMADARGYMAVESQECPPWESCGEVKIAYFVVTDTKSPELSAYLGVPDGDAVRFPIGCDEGGTIRYIPYNEMASSKQWEIPSDMLAALRASSPSAPIALHVSKAAWPEEGGTEGPVCVSPFFGYALSPGS